MQVSGTWRRRQVKDLALDKFLGYGTSYFFDGLRDDALVVTHREAARLGRREVQIDRLAVHLCVLLRLTMISYVLYEFQARTAINPLLSANWWTIRPDAGLLLTSG